MVKKIVFALALFLSLQIFIVYPWIAFIVAIIFLWRWRKTDQQRSLSAAIAWTLYGFYEYAMLLRILCSGECNIRVDLFIVYVMLLLLSLKAVGTK
jgi:hypothetical protein